MMLGIGLFMLGLGLRHVLGLEPTTAEYLTDFLMGLGVGAVWWSR